MQKLPLQFLFLEKPKGDDTDDWELLKKILFKDSILDDQDFDLKILT